MTTTPKPPRLIYKTEVCDRVGKTFAALWNWMRDGKFPMAREVGGQIAWLESEVDAWIENRPQRQYKPADPPKPTPGRKVTNRYAGGRHG
jgi:prophage regulatory protein